MVDARPSKIWLVLDSSGSIARHLGSLLHGANSFIDEQRSLMAECYIVIKRFGTSVRLMYKGSIENAPKIELTVPELEGNTSLCDAIGSTLADALAEPEFKHMVVIFTDGGENSSRQYGSIAVAKLMAHAVAQKIDVVYLGAGRAALNSALAMSIPNASTLSVAPTNAAYVDALTVTSNKLTSLRTGHDAAVVFTQQDRDSQYEKGAER